MNNKKCSNNTNNKSFENLWLHRQRFKYLYVVPAHSWNIFRYTQMKVLVWVHSLDIVEHVSLVLLDILALKMLLQYST